MTELIRCFVALELPEPTRQALADVQSWLRSQASGLAIRWADTSGIHLTLKFLGNVLADQIGPIQEAVEQASSGCGPLTLHLSGLGTFPNVNRPRVVWIGLAGDLAQLSALQSQVEDRLVPLGFQREHDFVPHLTLGRVREGARGQDWETLKRALERDEAVPPAPFEIAAVSLMRSVLTPSGPRYSRLYEAPLVSDQ
ncbi:MAG: RNA 2',3'-cyclic phosphodiesterase [Chloroflexi bacterium]|nr:RNA 2',3'-cyclic phosphodiesterase [Chloroflexota bacterium]